MSSSDMSERLHTLKRELGLINTLWYLLAKWLRRAGLGRVYRYSLFAQPVRTHAITPDRRTQFDFRFVEEREYNLEWFPRPAEIIRARYTSGARCLVAFKGETAIGCIWIVAGEYIEDEIFCLFSMFPKHQTVWDFDVYILPEFRFGRAFSRMWDAVESLLVEEGKYWCLSRIDVFNVPSMRAHQRRGAIKIGELVCVRSGGFQILLGTVAPYAHATYQDRHMPRVEVRAPSIERRI